MRRLLLVLGVSVFSILGVVGAITPSQASALTIVGKQTTGGYDTCRWFVTPMAQAHGGYWYTGKITVPKANKSQCKDINLRNISANNDAKNTCAKFRVRFYQQNPQPQTWATEWRLRCSDPNAPSQLMPLATDVIDGTQYRIEQAGPVWYNYTVVD